jgi:hypothetical protein
MLAAERLLPATGGRACPSFSPGIDSSQLTHTTGAIPPRGGTGGFNGCPSATEEARQQKSGQCKQQLFVAGSADETAVRLSLDGTPGDQAVIKTGFHTDNLRWGSDGFLYAAGQRGTVRNLWACAPTQRCTSPFSVVNPEGQPSAPLQALCGSATNSGSARRLRQ